MTGSPKKESKQTKMPAMSETVKGSIIAVTMIFVLFFLMSSQRDSDVTTNQAIRHRTATSSPDAEFDLSPAFVEEPDEGEFTPKMVWLMSYPNSGTSFTMMTVLRASNFSTATNYGDEVTHEDDFSLSIYPRRQEGPYWNGLSGKLGKPRLLPHKYVMVKTHCGSRCVNCGPQEYKETLESFVDACRKSSGRMAPDRRLQLFLYPVSRVHRAIHLVRNPLHNMVARFHLELKNYAKRGHQEWVDKHPNDAKGFRRWCKELDKNYKEDEFATFPEDLLTELQATPCHGEVFKYVQWHNLAFETIEKMGIPSLLIHYEDYEKDFDKTFGSIMDFLELELVGEHKEFSARSDYDPYFSAEEKDRIRQTAKLMASENTWREIRHYFEDDTSTS